MIQKSSQTQREQKW